MPKTVITGANGASTATNALPDAHTPVVTGRRQSEGGK